jgi:predicted phage-related endonuclease
MHELEEVVQEAGHARLIGHYESGSPEWLEARKGVGGSDIGTILGVNVFKTRAELMAEHLDPNYEAPAPSLPMKLGTAFENGIRTLWAENMGAFCSVVETGTWQHVANPEFKANPDGLINFHNGEIAILEIKYSMARELPQSWVCQVNWYMAILGLTKATIVQCAGNKFIEHNLTLDTDLAERMFNEARNYLAEMESKTNGL